MASDNDSERFGLPHYEPYRSREIARRQFHAECQEEDREKEKLLDAENDRYKRALSGKKEPQ